MSAQTETSISIGCSNTPFIMILDGALERLPPTLFEALLLVATVENSPMVHAGWAPPEADPYRPTAAVWRPAGITLAVVRRPGLKTDAPAHLIGRSLPLISGPEPLTTMTDVRPAHRSGWYHLQEGVDLPSVIPLPLCSAEVALSDLPAVPGPRTALFVLPFLAVGGAERLLFELLRGTRGRYRCLVVTLEPHHSSLGQTVDDCYRLTPHVYTLGDWLPREARIDALRHLIRRWCVSSLVLWNGTVDLYDSAHTISRDYPGLRMINQLFNHEGGWIEHYCPRIVDAFDLHIAVNDRIAQALSHDWGVPAERVQTIHHGVRIPPEASPEERAARRKARRRELGLGDDDVVIATFIRMHPQKRPLDILEVARRMAGERARFLLVGGGPLDHVVDRELEMRNPGNVTRLGLRDDTDLLYDAVDICLLCSEYEGLPVFLLDGLARGIPCVATAVGEIPELLANGGGIVVERPGDLDAIEAAVRALLDPARRCREGSKGRTAVANRHGLEGFIAHFESAIFLACHESASSSPPTTTPSTSRRPSTAS